MMRGKGGFLLSILVLVVLVASGCSSTDPKSGGSPTGATSGVLTMVGAEPPTLDPALVQDVSSSEYIVEIFSGLVALNTKMQVVPDLAESWDLSP
ncbi:MAG: hypothetical protein Q8P59_12430, partial [Dehalococcoidia bacterium]|nr:hypothetical protein [Dehalococcoidia bacterium]